MTTDRLVPTILLTAGSVVSVTVIATFLAGTAR